MQESHEQECSKDQECHLVIGKKDYYEILNVKRNATDEEIRKSYKKLAIKFHPDKNCSKFAEEAFKKVSHSFSVLSCKEKRERYDMFGSEEEGMTMNNRTQFTDDFDPFDLFNMFFSQQTGGSMFGGGRGGFSQFGRANSTSYRNGNVSYTVFSSFPSNGRQTTYTYSNGGDDSEDSEGDEEDMFFKAFSNFSRSSSAGNINNINNRKPPNNNNSNSNIHGNGNRPSNHNRNAFKLQAERVAKCIQLIPWICLFVIVVVPYLLRIFL
jgi:curved DNA-binding protein CbpA